MPLIPLGIGDWEASAKDVSRLRLHNMYLTDNPTSPDGVSRISRPTLTAFSTVGAGPIYAMWRQDATFDGDWLIVSGTQLYRFVESTKTATLIGNVVGTGYCQIVGTTDRVLIARDGVAYSTDGISIETVSTPDDLPVQSVATINGYFLLSVRDTQLFYWMRPGETDIDPLNFASAERIPDPIVSINVLMDEVWFIGSSGPEVWQTTGDSEIPFQRTSGRVYSDGCASRNTVTEAVYGDIPCLLWVTDSRAVVIAQGAVTKVSSEAVEERLKTATNLRAYAVRHNRHDFYILTSDEFTYVYDLHRQSWVRWDSYLRDNWAAHIGLMSGPTVYAGDHTTNNIWKFEEGYSDNGDPVIREVSGFTPNMGLPISCAMVGVRVNSGWSPSYTLEPHLEMRWSDDQGATWSSYVSISMGAKGRYDTDIIIRSLGLIVRPGRTFEFRFTDPATFRIDYAFMNEG